jgi:hypothetical protein
MNSFGIYSDCRHVFVMVSLKAHHWPAKTAILKPHENHEQKNGLRGNGLLHQDTAVFRQHYYILQGVLT